MEQSKRLDYIDSLRGITLVSMIAYHFTWDLVYIFHLPLSWMNGPYAYYWQQSICWSFISISGFCWSMGHHPLKNGCRTFFFGALITLITCLFMPEERIIFGILTFLGSAMLLMILLDSIMKDLSPIPFATLSFLAFLLFKNASRHYIGFAGFRLGLPDILYRNYLTTYLGFYFKGFYSTDYFPIIPWIFLFICGYFLHKCYMKYLKEKDHIEIHEVFFSFLGRNSIWIYMIHQPLLYGLLVLWNYLKQ